MGLPGVRVAFPWVPGISRQLLNITPFPLKQGTSVCHSGA